MANFLSVVFGEVDFNTVTPVALLCVYVFSLTMECIAGIFQSTLKAGGVNN